MGTGFTEEMMVSAGGSGSVLDNTQPPTAVPHCPVPAPRWMLPHTGSPLLYWLYSSAESLTQFHLCMT